MRRAQHPRLLLVLHLLPSHFFLLTDTAIRFENNKASHAQERPHEQNVLGDTMQTFADRPDIREALQALHAEELRAFTGLLSPRESVVLHGRVLGRPQRRQESLGRAMGISRDRVCQIEAEVIKKFEAWKSPQ
jgi:DNA-directed RNA polymerase sigma subunit (sigma70/sigma32)